MQVQQQRRIRHEGNRNTREERQLQTSVEQEDDNSARHKTLQSQLLHDAQACADVLRDQPDRTSVSYQIFVSF